MMEYTNKYWNMLMPFIKKSLNKRYGKAYTKALIPKARCRISRYVKSLR